MNLGEFTSDVRHHGLGRALVRAAYYRAQELAGLRVYRFMAMEPDFVSRELLNREVRYECRILSNAEARDLAGDPANGTPPEFLAAVLKKGDTCFAILDRGVPASFGWYSNAPTMLADVTVKFDPRYLYMFHGYTRHAYRGQNLHGIGLARACMEFSARGYAGMVTFAERVNFASLRSSHRVGYRDCGTAVVVAVGPRARIWQSRTPQKYALRLEPTR